MPSSGEPPAAPVAAAARRALAAAVALAALLAASPAARAIPIPRGLSGMIRFPTAHVSTGTSGFTGDTGTGASFTYPVMKAVEAGFSRVDGREAFHAKVQLLPTSRGTPLPAVAAGVQDLRDDLGQRRYFWVATWPVPLAGVLVNGGIRRDEGFFDGAPEYFGGLEYTFADTLGLKAEYDWGTRAGSVGVEVKLGPNIVAFDHLLDAFGDGPERSNLLGVSFHSEF